MCYHSRNRNFQYRTSARNARDVCRSKKAELITIDNVAEWSYVTRTLSLQ